MANNREKYIASKAYKRPVGSFTQRDDIREFAGSGPGRNYFAMENLQSQAPSFAPGDPRIDELKQRRRTWNRYQKYPAGEMLGKTPQQMQNEYMGLSRDLRQTAKPAYNKMYPLTGGFMDYADKGGIWGSILSGLAKKTLGKGKDYLDDLGLASLAAGDTKEDKERYITETFGPHREDIEELDFTDEYEGPWPHPEGEPSLVPDVFTPEVETREGQIQGLKDEIQEQIDNFENPFPLLPTQKDTDDAEQDRMDDYYGKSEQGEMVFADVPEKYEDYIERGLQEPLPFDEGREDYIRRQNEYVSPVSAPLGIPDPQGDFDKFQEYPYPEIGIEFGGEPTPPIIPFNDVGRETGIASMYGQGPMWGETDRRYEDEYRDHVERTGDRMTYEEFERAWERMHALPRGLHFQEPRAGLR